jgi:hypothetical protein
MDGYSFMLARNHLLIDWERSRERSTAPAEPPRPEDEARDGERRTHLLELYRQLEGCGR